MSLRLSSLDPNEPRAAKDCRTCNRRRVRCDRSLPSCRKCALKELQCPGYGLRIQWGQGVASRGRLTGKALPILESAPANPDRAPVEEERAFTTPPTESQQDYLDNRQPESSISPAEVGTPASDDLRNAFLPLYDRSSDCNPFAMGLDLSACQLPKYLQTQVVYDLVHYYDHVVAAVMPWLDGPGNAWRTIILPLAIECEFLLLAILALSAEHYSFKMGSTYTSNTGPLSASWRDRSLHLLARSLRTELSEEQTTVSRGPACAMLATILVLCNLEMIRCDNAVWRIHWKAARTIARRWTSSHHPPPNLDPGFDFLIKEAFVYDVFGSSTTFRDEDQISSAVVNADDPFLRWLQLIQEVTIIERRRHANLPVDEFPLHNADMHALQQAFATATNSSLFLSKHSKPEWQGLESLESDLVMLLNIYQQAGLLYSYQALIDAGKSATARSICVETIISGIRQIQNMKAIQHDLVWPYFLVGTESRGNDDRKHFAQAGLLEAMHSTAFSNCVPALEFLRRFWTTDAYTVPLWLQFARQESHQGMDFLVI
ncbi:uncharacterized protein PV06_01411 [Exophiala oligosperma]|uniref:Zn(2)-C6 fungal-type domain-containing protein n=1 Tax=Exophiala oligosperma TaxID=215243 RepID=A0A0D2E233_9EURO|nr:uncharacterized protein PV06_01411 [Exophiala oligosperma]KIW48850.1 hypothetical protein PV06_01411 [Exophiala oligosperma]